VVVVTDPASATDWLALSVLCGTMPGMAATASPPPADFAQLLDEVQHRVRAAHAATMCMVNGEMQTLYRTIGRRLLDRTRNGWSAEALERLGADLRAEFPNSIAFSPSNLDYMRRFAEAWPDPVAGGGHLRSGGPGLARRRHGDPLAGRPVLHSAAGAGARVGAVRFAPP